jgi:hypothetical protein
VGIEPNQRPARGIIYKPHQEQQMAEFKLSIETDDPEVFLKAIVLAGHCLDMTGEWAEAVNSEISDMGNNLINAIDLLTQCANDYAQYKLEKNQND